MTPTKRRRRGSRNSEQFLQMIVHGFGGEGKGCLAENCVVSSFLIMETLEIQ